MSEQQSSPSGPLELEDEQVCIATPADCRGVVDLCGDVYGGVDYISEEFDCLVQKPGVKGFLYKVKGELVAFVSTELIDSGRCIVFNAARVKPTFQGTGIYGRFRRQLFQQFANKQQYPLLQREASTLNAKNHAERKDAMIKSGWRLLEVRENSTLAFNASSLSRLTEKPPHQKVSMVTKDDLRDLLKDNSSEWMHLFPNKRAIIVWLPFCATAEDVDHMFANFHVQFYGTGPESNERGNVNGMKLSLLTAGSYYKCELGVCYFVDVFGQVSDGDLALQDHLNVHLQRLKQMPGLVDRIIVHVFYHQRLDTSLTQAMRELDASKMELLEEFVHLWERDLN